MRAANTALNLLSLMLVVAGLVLITTFFFGSPLAATNSNESSSSKNEFNVPVLEKNSPVAPKKASKKKPLSVPAEASGKASSSKASGKETKKQESAVAGPKDKTLRLTIPKMRRVENSVIPYTRGDNEEQLRDHTAIHLKGTGYPWDKNANVYVAGHRLGYLNTGSFLAFYDLNVMEKGDDVYLTDSTGKRYSYRVFKTLRVDPSDTFITRPVKGKNIVTLQTCTLPDYSQRLIVQAERVDS